MNHAYTYLQTLRTDQKRCMRRVMALVFALNCCSGVLAAQHIASLKTRSIQPASEQALPATITLVEALKRLEQQFQVTFLYRLDVVDGKTVPNEPFRYKRLNNQIEKILNPFNLKYQQISKNYFVVLPKHATPEPTPGPEEPFASPLSPEMERSIFSSNESLAAISIKGRVTDDQGEGLPGVSVLLKGTTTGTATDGNGNYVLTVPDGSGTLVFSFIGFVTQEVAINDRTTIDVKLSADIKALNEVVVVGYGTQKKGEITSAVASVSAEQFNKGNISNVSQLLQGKVAGLSISRSGGDPNGGFAIRLRGLSTLGANTQPLVVIDGQIGADLNTIDPNDIKSIDILKDGSAAAIYGTRGSAGVIIITTKSGQGGGFSVSYSGLVQTEAASRFTSHMSADEFRALGKGIDYGANTDWYKEITRTAVSHTHNLSFSGGNNSGTTYNASVNYRNSQGVAINTGFDQLNGRLNLTQMALKDRLALNLNMSTTARNSMLGYPEVFKYAAIYNPTAPVRSTDPLYDLTGGGYYEANFVDYANPVAALEQNTRTQEVKRFNFTGSAEYEIIHGLKFLVRYAQQTTSTYDEAYLPRASFHSRNFLGLSGFSRGGYAWKRDNEARNRLYESTLSYQGRFDRLSISAVAGYSYQDFLNKEFVVGGGNFVTDLSSEDFFTALDFVSGRGNVDSYKNGSKIIAFFGRVNLNYNDLAYLQATLRREGSTQFGVNNKWGMFPALSAGVNIDRLVDIPGVNSLKLRGSYGITGALPPQSYLSKPTMLPAGAKFYAGNDVYLQSYRPDKNPNPDLKWETKSEFDIGLDFVALNNRLTGTIDYYNRTTSDLIFNVRVPVPPNLVDRTWMNIGEMNNQGVEVSVGYDVIKNDDFTWNTRANFSTFNVKLTKLNPTLAGSFVGESNLGTPGQEQTQITRAVEGQRIGLFWGYQYLGVDDAGKYILQDRNNDGKIDNNDQTIIGNGMPKFDLGWTNTFQYKNFDLNFLLRGSFGHQLINTYRAFYENPNLASSYNVVKTKYYNPNITDGQIFSSLFVENASFVKLDNATLGYNFKLNNAGVFKNLRAYFTGQNLFVITDYTGVDPEVRYADENVNNQGATTSNPLAPGIDRRETWVLTRSFTLGVNVTF